MCETVVTAFSFATDAEYHTSRNWLLCFRCEASARCESSHPFDCLISLSNAVQQSSTSVQVEDVCEEHEPLSTTPILVHDRNSVRL